ncbi:MAG: excinuclease ABC subunit UvrA, partial [Ghiorsea sp.]|nr:excinuclease ABC subunit UvrA [Ghiorsea sp.]
HNIELVIDRLVIKQGIRTRLADSVETALKYGEGMLIALIGKEERLFSENCACAACGISYPEIEPRLFSFNSPAGACPHCDGLGKQTIFDPALVVNDALTLEKGAIIPWGGRETFMYHQTIEAVAKFMGADMFTPFKDLSQEAQKAILYGTGRKKVDFIFETATQARTVSRPFEGVIPNLGRRYRETSSEQVREELSQYINAIDCPTCEGSRLNTTARHVLLGDLSLPTICQLPLRETLVWISNLSLNKQDQEIAEKVVEEIAARLGFMIEVGLDYLSLNRTSGTLSGGEAQRIRLATQIGSALVGVLYILDEPSIGLHQRDNDRLLNTLKRLRDLGNSVIVVEHDEDAI